MSWNDYGASAEGVVKMRQVITKERHVDTKEYRGKNKGLWKNSRGTPIGIHECGNTILLVTFKYCISAGFKRHYKTERRMHAICTNCGDLGEYNK